MPLRCRKCRKLLPDGSAFCMFCGAAVEPQKRKNTRRASGSGSVYKMGGKRARPWVLLAPRCADTGARKTLGTFATQIEAEQALIKYMENASTDRADWTVEQFYTWWTKTDDYTKLAAGSKSSHTAAWSYFTGVKRMRMASVKTSHLQELIDSARVLGRKRSVCEKIKNLASILCKEAMRDDVISKNYALLLQLPAADKETKDIFIAEEICTLKRKAEADYQAKLILILIYSGMRESELLQLKNENINTLNWYAIGGEKTAAGKNRTIPIVEDIRGYVQELKGTDGLFIRMPDGRPMRREYFEKVIFKKYLCEIGLLNEPNRDSGEKWRLSPHSTRHTFATMCRKAGVKEDIVERVIGHTSYDTTDKNYVALDSAFLAAEMSKISTNANSLQTKG